MKHTLIVKQNGRIIRTYNNLTITELSTLINHYTFTSGTYCDVKRFFNKVTLELR